MNSAYKLQFDRELRLPETLRSERFRCLIIELYANQKKLNGTVLRKDTGSNVKADTHTPLYS